MTQWKALKDPQFLSKTAWEAIPQKGMLITEADNNSAHSAPVIAWCFGKEKEANARLIAAAPCLLEAIELALDDVKGIWQQGMPEPQWAAKARTAIAKATGKKG